MNRKLRELLDAPCIFCSFEGEGYYAAGTHESHCPWFRLAGLHERMRYFTDGLRRTLTINKKK